MDLKHFITRAEAQGNNNAFQHRKKRGSRGITGLLRTAAVILLAAVLTAGPAAAEVSDFSDMDDVPLSDGILRVYELSFSGQETVISIRLFPEENCQEAAEAMADRYGSLELTDAQGNPVMPEKIRPEVRTDDWETERWACCYMLETAGMDPLPESIGIRTEAGEILRIQTAE